MNTRSIEDYIFIYEIILDSREKVREKKMIYLNSEAALFLMIDSKTKSFQKVKEINSDYLYDIKNYINNILESDWKHTYRGEGKEDTVQYIENFSFKNKKKQISIQVENGNRPRIIDDFLLFLRQFYVGSLISPEVG